MQMVIIIAPILIIQLIINVIAVVWLRHVILDFCHSVHNWIDQAAADIAEKLRNQNYEHSQDNESNFIKLLNMVEGKMKKDDNDAKSEKPQNRFVSFDVLPINPNGCHDDACVQMITVRGTQSIIPTVYLDFGDNFAWNNHYDEITMNAVEKLLIQAFEKYDQIRVSNEIGRPVAFLYQTARHTYPSFSIEFGAKVLYRQSGSSAITIETVYAVIQSRDSNPIFNGQRVALYGHDILRNPYGSERDQMIREIIDELRVSDAHCSRYKAIIRNLMSRS